MLAKRIVKAFSLLAAVVLVASSSTHAATSFEEEEDVLVLTDDNFDDAIAQHDTLLVEFYAPWCGHCKNLAPEYAKAAKALLEQDPPIRIAKVDATAQTKVGERFSIQGFPTLKFFKGDVAAVKDYDGGRTSDEIQKWVTKKSGPAVKIIESADELEAIKEANDVVVFAVIDAAEGDARSVLEKVADASDLAVVVASTSKTVSEDAADVNKIVLFKKFDEGKNVYEGEFTEEAIAAFVKGNAKPLVITFSQEKAPMIFGGDINEHVLVFVDATQDYIPALETALKVGAKENKGKLLHVIVPFTETRIVEYFGIKEEDLPAVLVVNMGAGMKKYSFTYKGADIVGKLDSTFGEELAAFEKAYFAGEVTPTLKSAEPSDDSEEAVKVIVGKQFAERVANNEQDVLLEFYAPWCGHCKSLAPKYEELAENFADVKSILIAKIDATENEVDHPGVDVKGFPTILFFPGKDKQNPIVYEGARDVEGMTEFLKKNAQKFELDGADHGVEHEEL
ncbi:Protein disulfide-isomerase domain [Globisporangium polare]